MPRNVLAHPTPSASVGDAWEDFRMTLFKEAAALAHLAVLVAADILKPCRAEYRLPSRWLRP
jgi:hypothetical protein